LGQGGLVRGGDRRRHGGYLAPTACPVVVPEAERNNGTPAITCLPQGPPRDQADAPGSTPHNPPQGARGDGASRPRALPPPPGMIRSRTAASRAPAVPLRGRCAPL